VGLLAAFRRRPFLTETERAQLADGLAHARRHAGEPIELIIEARASEEPEARAAALLDAWTLPPAARARAVLIYACEATHRFAVVGGAEIRRIAPALFWDQVRAELARHFDDGRYCDGLFKVVARVAIQLHHHFHPTLPEDTPPAAPDGGG
jgi:uncharacterized membrane protein YgcG